MLNFIHRRSALTCPAALGRVVIADADGQAYEMLRTLTAPDRWAITDVSTPQQLVEALRGSPVRLAFVNLSLLSEEAEEILMARSRRGLRVVITSDEHNEENERHARQVGSVFYAPKPLQLGVLKQVVDGALSVAI